MVLRLAWDVSTSPVMNSIPYVTQDDAPMTPLVYGLDLRETIHMKAIEMEP